MEYLHARCNAGHFPAHMKAGRLVLLSKTLDEIAEISNTRPIVVLPHLTKIVEKALLLKLRATGSRLLDTGAY